jgi:O-antigen ligase
MGGLSTTGALGLEERMNPQGRVRLAACSDALVVAIAASLPWSTSATSILIGLWLIALAPTLQLAALRRAVFTPAGGLPVTLWLFAGIGMLWAGASWSERIHGLGGFHKLLAIPLLLMQFRATERGKWVFIAYVGSCTALLVLSVVFVLWPSLSWPVRSPGVPVKDYIAQSEEFVLCAFALMPIALAALRRRLFAAVGLGGLALLFLADVFYIATGRTALVIIVALISLLALRQLNWKAGIGLLLGSAGLLIAVWLSSSYLREQVANVATEVNLYQTENVRTRAGERIEFWKKSISFVAAAPVIGHGTGAIDELFRRSAEGQSGVSALASTNPHNETLTVAIQLGLIGVIVLYAMWIAHLLLFRNGGLAAWVGLIVVIENMIGSLFNSHLSDFTQGWTYVFGVGVAGGMVLRDRNRPSDLLIGERCVKDCAAAARRC